MGSMLVQIEDASGIKIGDPFVYFTGGGMHFHTGMIDDVTATEVYVDFDDFIVEYDRAHVRLMEENCGYIHSFYASPVCGKIVQRFV